MQKNTYLPPVLCLLAGVVLLLTGGKIAYFLSGSAFTTAIFTSIGKYVSRSIISKHDAFQKALAEKLIEIRNESGN